MGGGQGGVGGRTSSLILIYIFIWRECYGNVTASFHILTRCYLTGESARNRSYSINVGGSVCPGPMLLGLGGGAGRASKSL